MRRATEWAQRMVEEVLPDVPYLGLVFTIPKIIRKPYLFDRTLYGDLCRVAWQSTRDFLAAHFQGLDDPVPAMLAAPQSSGDLVNVHPHVHALCSLGVFSRDGAFHPAGDLDFWALEEIFRERMLKRMLERGKIDRARVELLRSWRHSGFSVHSERLIAQGARAELESLLEYMQRPPVSLKRLSILEDGRVLYLGTRYHPGLKRDHELVSGLEFVAMLVPHVSLRYQVTIRYYGAISTTIRRQLGWIEQGGRSQAPRTIAVIDDEDSEFVRLRRRSWAQLIRKVWLDDPELCERCGARMRIISALSSPARDDVIRKILESRGEWDPPWLKDGRRRGPPPRATDQPATGDRRSGCPETRIEYDPGYDPTEEWPLEA